MTKNISEKTLQDLEFSTVLRQVSEHCVTSLGNERTLQITPFSTKEALYINLQLTNEYLSTFYNDNRIPNHGFDAITKEIKLLRSFCTVLNAGFLSSSIFISSN